jgi:hypothetical protein
MNNAVYRTDKSTEEVVVKSLTRMLVLTVFLLLLLPAYALAIPPAAPIPEPSTFLLVAAGLVGAGLLRKKFKK